jgi:cysteine desulfurase/selenocysteine lyase
MIQSDTIQKSLDVYAIRQQFPILKREVKATPGDPVGRGKRLVYFDNAATSQKPQSVIDALINYYTN